MTVVLDAHGITVLSNKRAYLEELRRRGEWPAVVPAVVLTEALTGDHRLDHRANRLLQTCQVRPVDELLARAGAALRTAATGRRRPSAVDAIVVATAAESNGATILTSDPQDLRILARRATTQVTISAV